MQNEERWVQATKHRIALILDCISLWILHFALCILHFAFPAGPNDIATAAIQSRTWYNKPAMDAPTSDNMPLGRLADAGRCRECGYLLRGLTEPRCPECGRPFDPEDPSTMDLPEHLRPGKPPKLPGPYGDTMLLVAGFVVSLSIINFILPSAQLRFFTMLWIAITWVRAGESWYKRNHATPEELQLRPEGFRHWRRVMQIALVITILALPRYYSCCHANTVWLGPIGISYSTHGGPCNSEPHHGGKQLGGNWYWAW